MNEVRENLLGLHLSRMLVMLSDLGEAERGGLAELVIKLVDAMAEGNSCLPIGSIEKELLAGSGLVADDCGGPLVVVEDYLYTQRNFSYESRLAHQVAALAAGKCTPSRCGSLLDAAFGADQSPPDLQKRAAQYAVENQLCIISGGPGTGKTSTVVRILGVLFQIYGPDCKVVLTAPTGKAAMRLRQAVSSAVHQLPFTEEIQASIPDQALTLHRLLGVKRFSPQFYHNRDNPLAWDVVVVDEASMVDLALMSKLVDALRPGAKLILLGDKDQLVSVESGAVLADLIESLPENTVVLQKSYRFDEGIRSLAEAVNGNQRERALSLLANQDLSSVAMLQGDMQMHVANGFKPYFDCINTIQSTDYHLAFEVLNRFRLLSAIRSSSMGVAGLNALVEKIWGKQPFPASQWYIGRPVMIQKNDYSLQLYNGDIGICLPDPEDTVNLKVWFETSEGQLRSFPPLRLPRCETAFAMTIHKSQGSEFEEVLVVFPDEDSPLLSRELLYTAITRAKKRVRISCDEAMFTRVLSRRTNRTSGLGRMLRRLPARGGKSAEDGLLVSK